MQNITASTTTPVDRPSRGTSRFRSRRKGSAALVATGAAVALGLVASACGSKVEASPAWCAAIGELDATLAQIGQPDPEAVRTAFSDLESAATTIAERAPRRVKTAAAKIDRAIEAGAESGEPTLFDPATSSAMADVHAHAAQKCAYTRVSVVATDYAFVGIPNRVKAGKVAFALDNQSKLEDHEIVLFVKSEGVDAPITELLALPEEEAMTKARPVGFTMAEADGHNGLILDLEPGNYAAVCFVPVGGNEEAAPHFVHGMVTDFVVG